MIFLILQQDADCRVGGICVMRSDPSCTDPNIVCGVYPECVDGKFTSIQYPHAFPVCHGVINSFVWLNVLSLSVSDQTPPGGTAVPPPVAALCSPCPPCPAGQVLDPNTLDSNGCLICNCKLASILGKICPYVRCDPCSPTDYRNTEARGVNGCPVCGPCIPRPSQHLVQISKLTRSFCLLCFETEQYYYLQHLNANGPCVRRCPIYMSYRSVSEDMLSHLFISFQLKLQYQGADPELLLGGGANP